MTYDDNTAYVPLVSLTTPEIDDEIAEESEAVTTIRGERVTGVLVDQDAAAWTVTIQIDGDKLEVPRDQVYLPHS